MLIPGIVSEIEYADDTFFKIIFRWSVTSYNILKPHLISWLLFVLTTSVLWLHTHNQFCLLQRLCLSCKDEKDWMEQQVRLALQFIQQVIYKFLMILDLILLCSRGMSTVHAILITMKSVYLVFLSDLFSDQLDGPVTFRSSHLSNFTLGVCYYFVVTVLAGRFLCWHILHLVTKTYRLGQDLVKP